MRTMNKIVALSLVLAMALSMMASAASFKDQSDINANLVDDINLLVALNVFSAEGTGEGYFDPNGTITRSMAAKMMYVLKNKGVDNGATSWTGLNIFADVEAGAWYEGYANYCASTGIMIGTAERVFAPNKELTGTELAKMLLVLIGYKADIEGYTGAGWDANILADAEEAGILEAYELPVKVAVTRQWAAKMIVNALYATMVKYEDGEAVEMYGTTTTYENGVFSTTSTPVTYAQQNLNIVKTVGMLTATPNVELGVGAINADGDNDMSELDFGAISFKYAANEALLGQKVTVLSKGALSSTAKVYGVVAHEDVTVVDTTIDAVSISEIANNNNEVNVKINGVTKKYNVENNSNKDTLDIYVDYALAGANYRIAANPNTNNFVKTYVGGVALGSNDGRAIKFIDNNNDGKYDVVMLGSVVYGKVGYINAANHAFRIVNGLSVTTESAYNKLVFVDTVAKDDIVKITKDFASGVEKTVIEKMDVVTGAISKVANTTTATIEGVEYKLAANNMLANNYAFATDTKAQDYFVDGKYVVYTDAIGSTGSEIQTNIAYVIAKKAVTDDWTNVSTNKVELLKNDGTREILAYDDEIEGVVAFDSITVNAIGEYVMKDGKVGLKGLTGEGISSVSATAMNNGKHFDKSANKFFSGTTTYLVNDETYFFVVDLKYNQDNTVNTVESKYSVMKAAEINGDMDAALTFGYASEGMPYLYFAVLTGANPGGDASTGIGIAAGTVNEIRENGTRIFTLEVTKFDGTVVTLKNTTNTGFNAVKNQFVTYNVGTTANSGTATKLAAVANATASAYEADAIVTIDGNKLMLAANGYMEVASDAKIYYIDAYKSSGADRVMNSVAEGLVEAAEIGEDNQGNPVYAKNILFNLNSDLTKIDTIIIEVDGEALTCYTPAN